MKKIIAFLILCSVTLAYGHGVRPPPVVNHYHSHHDRDRWVGPMLGGVLLGIAVTRASEPPPAPPIIISPPIIIPPPPVVQQPGVSTDPYGRVIINNRVYYTYICTTEKIDPFTGERRTEPAVCVR